MSAEEQLEQFKEQTRKENLKKARRIAAVFGGLAITALIVIVYAFFQHAAALRAEASARIELLECTKLAEERDNQILKLRVDLEKQTLKTEAALKEALIQNEAARKRGSK